MNILRASRPKSSLLFGSLLALGIPAFAVPITGGYGTVAPGVLSFANAGNTVHKIDFCPQEATSPGAGINPGCSVGSVPAGTGTYLASGGFGTFAPIVNFVSGGSILDLVDQPGNAPFTYFPVGPPNQNINNFLTLSGPFAGFNFQADQFVFQNCATTLTTQCIGGFILTQVGQNVAVSMTVNGSIFAAGYDDSLFTYVISGQFNNTTIGAVAAAAQTTAGVYSNTWSGSLVADVPEPGTITMLGIGAMAILIGRLRAKRGSDSK